MFSFIFNPKSRRTIDEITFKRFIGFNDKDDLIRELVQIRKELENRTHLYFNSNLEMKFKIDIVKKVEAIISELNLSNLDWNIINELSELMNTHNELNVRCFTSIIDLFLKNEKVTNINILENFIIKIISWSNLYCTTYNKGAINIYPPCAIFVGDIRKHEVYFFIYLNMLGWDIIYVNPENIDPIEKYSIKNFNSILISGNCFEKISNDEIDNYIEQVKIANHQTYNSLDEWIQYFKTLDDVVLGDVFIGHDVELEEYSLKILEVVDLLKSKYSNLITIINGLESPSIDEINKLSKDLVNISDFSNIINGNMPKAKKYFENIVNEFSKNNNSDSIIKNFSLKMLIWLMRYRDNLMYGKTSILFFGKIKVHEIYFLKLINSLGISVIYINPNKDNLNLFKEIKGFYINEFTYSSEMNEFPKEHSIKRQETITYKASKEIEKFLHEGDDGLFKPYQLNRKKMNIKILASTLEEFLVIWDEPSQYRTGFSNTETLVEIPNIFMKISGVHSDIKKYWEMFSKLKNCENSLLINDAPISIETISKQEFSRAAFIFNPDWTLNVENLMNSDIYKDKLNYLNLETQYLIIDKIQQLMDENIFTQATDKKLKIEILMTIINIDEKFLKMIEKHKFGDKVPKIIIYKNNKDKYSIRDVIIIMFLVLIGFDIVFLCPTAYNNIELLINNNLFETFRLETVAYDLEIPAKMQSNKQSIFTRLFGI